MINIKKYLSLIIVMFIAGFTNAVAQENIDEDSLMAVRMAPDYVKVSILCASEGDAVYSASGHCGIRMQCPSQNIDYLYDYEMGISVDAMLEFIKGKARGAFMRKYTNSFIEEYQSEGRGVSEISLNLLPEEELRLWQSLDEEVKKGSYMHFDYLHNDCSGMGANIIENNILPERIELSKENEEPEYYNNLSYRNLIPYILKDSPWVGMFWNIMLGVDGTQNGHLYPRPLMEEWQKATVVDTVGTKRPLVEGKEHWIVEPAKANKPRPVNPKMAFVAFFVLCVVVTLVEWKKGLTLVGRVLDTLIFAAQTIMGIGMVYLVGVSDQVATSWNWLIIILNPLPIILWLIFRNKPIAKGRIKMLFAVVLVAYLLATPLLPQMQVMWLWVVVAGMAIRAIRAAL